MKQTILLIAIAFTVTFGSWARKGVVVAHYGSSNDETRALTIDRITADIRNAVGEHIPVKEAYISPVVRKNLTEKGLHAISPEEAMLALRIEGIDTLILQPSLIIDGGEMLEVTRAADKVRQFFADVKIGKPLCYSPQDFEQVVNILSAEPDDGADAVIFVGHGNSLPSTATYTQLDYMLADRGATTYHVSTIEGFPTAHTTARQLIRQSKRIKKLKLVPFLLVCGNHTINDIAGEYAETLQKLGFQTQVLKRGLAELPEIRQLYTQRVLDLMRSE